MPVCLPKEVGRIQFGGADPACKVRVRTARKANTESSQDVGVRNRLRDSLGKRLIRVEEAR